MASDYAAIKHTNLSRFGTDIGRIGRMLLADRYDDRTHFIFELLQNAEDALARRSGWAGRRSVTFRLTPDLLRFEHFGIPFDTGDVNSICGIGESRKDLTAIGHFGIGFKSVFAFTDCPEIHSGDEHFAIDSYVWPRAVRAVETPPGVTVIQIPLSSGDHGAFHEIANGLRRLSPRTLLFLRELEEIEWSVDGGDFGVYLRSQPHQIADDARKVTLIGERSGQPVTEESLLVFSRAVFEGERPVGFVELAFALDDETTLIVRPVESSPLVVYFPTVLSTNFGFIAQGPYRTTPSRDNVPRHDPWNQLLVRQTGDLLVESLRQLREMGSLTTNALRCLPIDRKRFGEDNMFAAVFDRVRAAFQDDALLPKFGGGYVAAGQSRLARTQDLRELLTPSQLTELLDSSNELAWVSEEITQDRTPDLRQYLLQELGLSEIVLETILPRLTRAFLEAQSDEWIARLYDAIQSQPALLRSGRLTAIPLVRLETGRHVPPAAEGHAVAFLPGAAPTDFPTVSKAVLTPAGLALLTTLGLTEPDPVDDVIRNVLPRYREQLSAPPESYAADVARMIRAFETDSTSRRQALIEAIRDTAVLAALDAGTGATVLARPETVYWATQRLRQLFDGVSGVLIADDSQQVLRGESVRNLFEACGASRYLMRTSTRTGFDHTDLAEMRRRAGWANSTGGDSIEDYTIRGLDPLVRRLRSEGYAEATVRATSLWDALCDLHDRSGRQAFSGSYSWWYVQVRSCEFDAAFVRILNREAWVPAGGGQLKPPGAVRFDSISPPWKPNPMLQSRIQFKPPLIEILAREAGFEPGVLDLLKRLGLTNEADLVARLDISSAEAGSEESVESDEFKTPLGADAGSADAVGTDLTRASSLAAVDDTSGTQSGNGS